MSDLLVLSGLAGVAVGVAAPAGAGTVDVVFTYTGGEQIFHVPAGISFIHVEATGAPGSPGSLSDQNGGAGVVVAGGIDDVASLAISDATVTEVTKGPRSPPSPARARAPAGAASSVNWSTANGTATAPYDYVSVPATVLHFAAEETTKTVSVTVKADTAVEANETFSVRLSGATGASLLDSSGLGRITSDDGV